MKKKIFFTRSTTLHRKKKNIVQSLNSLLRPFRSGKMQISLLRIAHWKYRVDGGNNLVLQGQICTFTTTV